MSKPRRRGGPPTYTPETAAARRLGQVKIRLTPEEAARLRALGAGHPGGVTGVVRDWLRLARPVGGS